MRIITRILTAFAAIAPMLLAAPASASQADYPPWGGCAAPQTCLYRDANGVGWFMSMRTDVDRGYDLGANGLGDITSSIQNLGPKSVQLWDWNPAGCWWHIWGSAPGTARNLALQYNDRADYITSGNAWPPNRLC